MLAFVALALTSSLSVLGAEIELPPGYSRGMPLTWHNPDFVPAIHANVSLYESATLLRFVARQGCKDGALMCTSGSCCDPGNTCCGTNSCCPFGYVICEVASERNTKRTNNSYRYSCVTVNNIIGCCLNGVDCDASTLTATCTPDTTFECASSQCCRKRPPFDYLGPP